jgi:myo-inositol-hexaphosphate 3-phosphohydrolase
MSDDKRNVIAHVVMEVYTIDGNPTWLINLDNSEVYSKEIKDVYKLSLLTAQIVTNVRKALEFMDAYIGTKEEVRRIHNELMVEQQRGKPVPDTKKYQTKLPFEGEGYDSRSN